MAKSNKVCRSILDTSDVIKTQLQNTLIESLVASNTITQENCAELSKRVDQCVDTQINGLIDRVLVHFQE